MRLDDKWLFLSLCLLAGLRGLGADVTAVANELECDDGACDAQRGATKSLLQKSQHHTSSNYSVKRLAICIAGGLRSMWTAAPTLHAALNLASLPQSIQIATFVSTWSDVDTECACQEGSGGCSSAQLEGAVRQAYAPLNVHSVSLHREANRTLFSKPKKKLGQKMYWCQYWLWADSIARAIRWNADVVIKSRPDFAFWSFAQFQWHKLELDSLHVDGASCDIAPGTICSFMSDIHKNEHVMDDTLLVGEASAMQRIVATLFDNMVSRNLHLPPEQRLQRHISRQGVRVQHLHVRSRYGHLPRGCSQGS